MWLLAHLSHSTLRGFLPLRGSSPHRGSAEIRTSEGVTMAPFSVDIGTGETISNQPHALSRFFRSSTQRHGSDRLPLGLLPIKPRFGVNTPAMGLLEPVLYEGQVPSSFSSEVQYDESSTDKRWVPPWTVVTPKSRLIQPLVPDYGDLTNPTTFFSITAMFMFLHFPQGSLCQLMYFFRFYFPVNFPSRLFKPIRVSQGPIFVILSLNQFCDSSIPRLREAFTFLLVRIWLQAYANQVPYRGRNCGSICENPPPPPAPNIWLNLISGQLDPMPFNELMSALFW